MSSFLESQGTSSQPQVMQAPAEQHTAVQPQQQPTVQLSVTKPETPAQSSTGIVQQSSFKNRLQEYTHKAGIPCPQYRTVNEGLPHAPMFRSTVEVVGQSYTSPNVFPHRKAAEVDVARIALENLPQIREENCNVTQEDFAFIQEDTIFCKSILKEFADKMQFYKPVYKTENEDGFIPSFVSSVVFNGERYDGYKGKSKKESQQLAARDVILSILGSDARVVISEIIKSKRVLQAAKVFVSPTSEQSLVDATSGKKRKRKNKKAKNKAEVDARAQVAEVSSNQTSACLVVR